MGNDPIRARLALKRRDEAAARSSAAELQRLGFEVLGESTRGVSFEGPIELFEMAFSTEVQISSSTPRFLSKPTLPAALGDTVESIYFPTKPTFFAEGGAL